jgi:hypothetical protein
MNIQTANARIATPKFIKFKERIRVQLNEEWK